MRGLVLGVVANVLPRPLEIARAGRDVVDRPAASKTPLVRAGSPPKNSVSSDTDEDGDGDDRTPA